MTDIMDAYRVLWMSGQRELAEEKYGGDVAHTAVVLEAVEVIPPVLPPVITQFPETLIPRPLAIPTAGYVGNEVGGGSNVPFSAGPVSLITLPPAIGTMLIMIGGRVAVSIAVRGANDLYVGLKKQYHRRDALLKVFTGIGKKALGRSKEEDPSYPQWQEDHGRVAPRGDAHPGEYDLDNWDDTPIVGGPAFPFLSAPLTMNFVNTYGPEFGSWLQ